MDQEMKCLYTASVLQHSKMDSPEPSFEVHVCSPVFITEARDLLSLQENMFLQPVSEERVLEQLDLQATRLV